MEPSYRIVPTSEGKTASIQATQSSLGLHDTLQYGPKSLATEVQGGSALQPRLDNWEETQDCMKLTLQRNLHGVHAPVRLLMERKIVAFTPHMPALSQSNIHLDILMGRDEEIDISDFAGAGFGPSASPMSIHADMEKKLRM